MDNLILPNVAVYVDEGEGAEFCEIAGIPNNGIREQVEGKWVMLVGHDTLALHPEIPEYRRPMFFSEYKERMGK